MRASVFINKGSSTAQTTLDFCRLQGIKEIKFKPEILVLSDREVCPENVQYVYKSYFPNIGGIYVAIIPVHFFLRGRFSFSATSPSASSTTTSTSQLPPLPVQFIDRPRVLTTGIHSPPPLPLRNLHRLLRGHRPLSHPQDLRQLPQDHRRLQPLRGQGHLPRIHRSPRHLQRLRPLLYHQPHRDRNRHSRLNWDLQLSRPHGHQQL